MKQTILSIILFGYLLLPSCQHPNLIDPTEPVPIDTTIMLSCEDTIEVNFPGTMEKGFIKAIKTCRDFLASGYAQWPGPPSNHLNISGKTYYPHILTSGDTVFLYAEGFSFIVPKKLGILPVTSSPGLHSDKVTCNFNYLDVDVLLAGWLVDSSFEDNRFEITELDLANKRVKGKFNIHLTIDNSLADFEDYPSKLYFHEGEFDLEIIH